MPQGYRKDGTKIYPPKMGGWNKGKKRYWNSPTEFKKGMHYSRATEFKKGEMSEKQKGDKNSCWRGGISKSPDYKAFNNTKRRARKTSNGGSHTFGEWENLKIQYNYSCPCCHKSEPDIKLTQDHIIPLSKGGSDNIENIQPLCFKCNMKKHTKVIKYEIQS